MNGIICKTCIWQGHFTKCEKPDGKCEYTKAGLPDGYADLIEGK